MPDDSLSDVTDLDKDEVLAKYYEDKLSLIDKKRRDRAEARARLIADNKAKGLKELVPDANGHICKVKPKNFNPLARNKDEETVELELRPIEKG